MHVAPLIPFIKPTLDALKAALGATRRKLGKRKYEQVLSAAIKELLQQHPDISAAEAQLTAIRATGAEPDASLLRAEEMLRNVRGHARRRAMTAATKAKLAGAARARWARRRSAAKKTKPRKASGRKRSSQAKRKA